MKQAKIIPMTEVTSSQIASIGHIGDTLAVTFKNGGTYHYHGVSAAQFGDMKQAKSIGSFLSVVIKPNFKFTKIPKKSL
jgi:hypothetical protein